TIFNDANKCKAVIELSKSLRDNLTEFQKTASLSSTLDQFKLAKASILTNVGRIETDRENYLHAEYIFNESRGIYDELKSYFDAGITTMTQYKERRNISALHNNIGILLYKTDRIDEARKEFNIALRYSESARVYNNLGNTYFKKGDKVKATECYLNALQINPTLKEAKENLRMLKEDKEKPANWWEWWFNRQSYLKFITGLILIFMFLSVIITVFIPLNAIISSYAKIDWSLDNSEEKTTVITTPITEVTPAISSGFNKSSKTIVDTKTDKVTNETRVTTKVETTVTSPTKTETTKTTSKQIDVSPETKLLFAALILFALIHPQIKGFSAGSVKFDLEPIVASKGAASLQCAW
ncbi:MAG: tetratricopeptide repeat protein, partial [Methanothrix sp.]|nr:tetratricopeptide repeat protein [Methanothrix sp.]